MLTPEWLQTTITRVPENTPMLLVFRIAIALILGAAVAGIYRWARRGQAIQPTFLVTLILLSTVIAMATQIIGDNIARAFSLVGALSVVRFRTVVKDTQDTAFVIFAVVVGMAAGTDHLSVGLVGLAVIGAASLVLWPRPRGGEPGRGVESTITLRLGLADGIRETAEQVLLSQGGPFEPLAAVTARQGSAIDVTYRLWLRADCTPADLVTRLNMLEGVHSVELKRED